MKIFSGLLFIFSPIFGIASLNILFGLQIEYSLFTYIATLFLILTISPNFKITYK